MNMKRGSLAQLNNPGFLRQCVALAPITRPSATTKRGTTSPILHSLPPAGKINAQSRSNRYQT